MELQSWRNKTGNDPTYFQYVGNEPVMEENHLRLFDTMKQAVHLAYLETGTKKREYKFTGEVQITT